MTSAIWNEYRSKLTTADKAVRAVKSGDNVYYSHFAMFPKHLDAALAKRVGEVTDVNVINVSGLLPAQVALNDPEQKSFIYESSFSATRIDSSRKKVCVSTARAIIRRR